MHNGKPKRNWIGLVRWRPFRIDALLFIFLLGGWSLIFTAATWGLQRTPQQWLPINLVAQQVSADYGPDATDAPQVAPVDLEIIEAVKQDSQRALETNLSPTLAVALAEPITFPTSTPTITPTLRPEALVVSAGGPYKGDEGSPIAVAAGNLNSLLGLMPGTVRYRWDLNGDGLYDDAQGAMTSVVFYDEGLYPVAVQATDLLGRVATDVTNARVRNVPPTVEVGVDLAASETEDIEFLATVQDPGNDVLFYEWDFGDGSRLINDTLRPEHSFGDDGHYVVRLRAWDNDGGVDEDNLIVSVGNLPPLVNAGSDQVTNEGQSVSFKGSATDPSDLDTLTYAWDLDFDGRTFTPDVSGPTASTTYPDGPANIVAALRVKDDDGGQTIDTVNVTVNNLPPTILNVSNDGPQGEGSSLTLVVEATDVKDDTLTYAFDWNNDGKFDSAGQSASVSNIWFNQGNYPVGIRVRDKDQGEVFTTTVVSTYNLPPVAIANADSVRFEGDLVAFDASESYDPGINDVLTYTWSFGDGSAANGINVTHTYADNNVYSTTLAVMDDSRAVSTDFVPVTILNANPVANAGLDRVVDEGVQLELAGTATDPGIADTLTYAWDFVYDGVVFDEEATGASATVTYLDGPAEIDVALRVRDDDYNPSPSDGGEPGQAIDTLNVTVENIPPWNVTIVDPPGNPYRTTTGMPVTFRGTGTDVLADPLTYRWDFDYDGLTFDQDATGQVVTHTWQVSNDYQVALRVYDDDNSFTLSTKTVNVGGPPTAVAMLTPTTISEGRPVLFDGTGSSDPDNDPLSYTWNFGDGSPTSNSITGTHTYTDVGVFTATLRVNDNRGGAATDDVVVSVENIPPAAVVSASPNPTIEGSAVSFDGSGSSAGPYDSLTYEWNFGDGSPLATGINVTHTYGNNGVYTATLTVADDDNTASTASVVVNIQDLIPVADAGPDRTVFEGDSVTLDGSASRDPGFDSLILYEWDFDYDGANFNVDATGPIVTTSYPDGPANYTVALRVTDDGGAVSPVDTAQVTVENLPPMAAAGPDQTVFEGDNITFDGGASSDPGADSLILYEWDFDYDGASFNVDATGPIVTTSYPDGPAAYTVALRVTDDDGAVSLVDTAQMTIENLPPTADSGGPYVAAVNTPLTLNASGSDVPQDILSFSWDLDNDAIFERPGQTVTYTWTVSGTYTVVLQVSDDDGGVTYSTTSVQVNSLMPIVLPGTFYFLIRGTRYAYLKKRKRKRSS